VKPSAGSIETRLSLFRRSRAAPAGRGSRLDERLVAEAEREAGVGADLNRVRRLVDGDGVLGAGGRRGEDSAREGGSGNAKRTGHAISGKAELLGTAPRVQHRCFSTMRDPYHQN
jgi:hypothetical protein